MTFAEDFQVNLTCQDERRMLNDIRATRTLSGTWSKHLCSNP